MSRKEIEMALQAQYRSTAVERSFQPGEDRAHRPSTIIWVAVGSAVLAACAGTLVGRALSSSSTTVTASTVAAPAAVPQVGTNANAREGRVAAGAPAAAQSQYEQNLRAHLLSLPPTTTVSATSTNANAREGRTAISISAPAVNPNLTRDVTATRTGIGPGPTSHSRLGPVERHADPHVNNGLH